MENYRNYEIHADLAGYGYLAHKPNYDGENCLHGWTMGEIKSEIDQAISDQEIVSGDYVVIDTTTEVLLVIAVSGDHAWLADDAGNKMTLRHEDLVIWAGGRPSWWN